MPRTNRKPSFERLYSVAELVELRRQMLRFSRSIPPARARPERASADRDLAAVAFQEQGVAGRSHRRGFAEVQRVDRESGKPRELAPKRSDADEAVVAQLLQLDAPRDLKIEFEMSIS